MTDQPQPSLPDKIVALHSALRRIPHAFGGAIALAYYAEPRSTIDVDLNVFVPVTGAEHVLDRLALLGVDVEDIRVRIQRDGQGRAMWGRTPVDLFFAYDRFHDVAAKAVRDVPFTDTTITILGPEHLVVCKAVFDRPRDWVDIDAMLQRGTRVDVAEVLRWVGRIVGDTDRRYDRVAAVLTA